MDSMDVRFQIDAIYPNPLNPRTTIVFSLPEGGWVLLTVYDLLGREVTRLVDSPHEAGRHSVEWNASDVSSGMYFIRIQTGSFAEVKKVMTVR